MVNKKGKRIIIELDNVCKHFMKEQKEDLTPKQLFLNYTIGTSDLIKQIAIISDSVFLVPLEIPTIELSGGSVRCTIADIHLSPRVE